MTTISYYNFTKKSHLIKDIFLQEKLKVLESLQQIQIQSNTELKANLEHQSVLGQNIESLISTINLIKVPLKTFFFTINFSVFKHKTENLILRTF